MRHLENLKIAGSMQCHIIHALEKLRNYNHIQPYLPSHIIYILDRSLKKRIEILLTSDIVTLIFRMAHAEAMLDRKAQHEADMERIRQEFEVQKLQIQASMMASQPAGRNFQD